MWKLQTCDDHKKYVQGCLKCREKSKDYKKQQRKQAREPKKVETNKPTYNNSSTCNEHSVYKSGCEACKKRNRAYNQGRRRTKNTLPYIPCREDINCPVCKNGKEKIDNVGN